MKKYDFLIIGGGIFGMTTAVELAKRQYKVGLLNPDTIPHHLAASTDVSKIVRMEYGSDQEYFQMVEICIDRWKEWNDFFEETLYHEVGFLMLCQEKIESPRQLYEKQSIDHLLAAGYPTDRLDGAQLKARFPMVNSETYIDANFNPKAGFAESARVVACLADYARSLGVDIHERQSAVDLVIEKNQLTAVKTKEGETFACGHCIVAAGAHTPLLVPDLQPFMHATGHPVFWLKPQNPIPFTVPNFTVFAADISNTGWYGFPFSKKQGIIKIAKHSNGLKINPDKDDRQVTDAEIEDFRNFLKIAFPDLVDAPLVFTRRCLYTDTLDGHFWIDNHPAIKGLSVSTGGSGHGFKMAPLLGEMTADIAEGKSHQFSKRYCWRHLSEATNQLEEARNMQ